MARLGGTALALAAAGDTTVDSTAQYRSVRVRVYNRDTVQHSYTFKLGTHELKNDVLQPKESSSFGPEHAASGQNLIVNVAEATTTNASEAVVTGEWDG